jgi:hypothetical protein
MERSHMRNPSKALWGGVAAAAVLLWSGPAFAQASASANINATVTVAARARITLTGAIAFPDMDPATNATINAAPLDVQVQARTAPGGSVTLTVLAGGDFVDSGGASIPVTNLSWTSTGAGFVPGTMSQATAQNVGTWSGPGARSGQQTYTLVNSWNYVPGNYAVTLTYTLTAP